MTTQDIKNWYKNCKTKLVTGFGGKCCICGYSKCIDAFDFHHIKQEDKKFNISSYTVKNWELIVEEVKKCVLLCAVCHRELHAGVTTLPSNPQMFNGDLIPRVEKKEAFCQTCGKKVNNLSTQHCKECYSEIDSKKKFEVSFEELERLVNNHPLTFIAKQYNVSDKAIQKRCEKLGIPLKGRGYWSTRKHNAV